MTEMEKLVQRAEELGIPNASLYWLLPVKKREDFLRKDIEKAEKAAQSTPEDE